MSLALVYIDEEAVASAINAPFPPFFLPSTLFHRLLLTIDLSRDSLALPILSPLFFFFFFFPSPFSKRVIPSYSELISFLRRGRAYLIDFHSRSTIIIIIIIITSCDSKERERERISFREFYSFRIYRKFKFIGSRENS